MISYRQMPRTHEPHVPVDGSSDRRVTVYRANGTILGKMSERSAKEYTFNYGGTYQ